MQVQQQGQTHVVHYVGQKNTDGCCGVPAEASCAVTGVRLRRRTCAWMVELFGHDYRIETMAVGSGALEGERGAGAAVAVDAIPYLVGGVAAGSVRV